MDLGIAGKVALVTGGTSGIGFAAAQSLLKEGAKVVITNRNQQKLDQAAKELGDGIFAFKSDSTDSVSITALKNAVDEKFGPVSILVNAAGTGGAGGDIVDITDKGWLDTFDVNVVGSVRYVREFVADMQAAKWGRIVLVGSEDGYQPHPGGLPYATSKAAVLALSKGLSKTYADDGVLVNCVSPAFIETPMTNSFVNEMAEEKGVSVDQAVAEFLKTERPTLELKRRGRPEEVGNVITFLCSELASFVTGDDYRVDGGSVASI